MSTTEWVIVYEGASADTGLLRGVLAAAAIPVRLGDEVMGTMAPYLIEGGALAAIKVLVPSDRADDARRIVESFRASGEDAAQSGAPAIQPWECPCCHERNDGTFDICWNCQTERRQA